MNRTQTDPGDSGDILIVEDDPSGRRLLTDMLSGAGYRVRPAGDAEMALRSVRLKPPELIVLDIRLPGMDGWEMCRQLKADDTSREIPVIFISALNDKTDQARGFELGAVDYITKPFQSAEVLARVKVHLTLRRLQMRLEQANAEMEERVRLRTLELAALNKRLAESEASARKNEERFRLMFMNAPMPYQSLDAQGNFLDFNQVFLDVLGYQREELIGRNFADILHPDWRNHFKENFPRFKAVGEILGVEFEMIKKDGASILVHFNGKVQRDDHGGFQRTHCVFLDITDRKKMEIEKEKLQEQLIRTQKIESIGIVSGGIAHEFNNLLSIIVGNAELALEDMPGIGPAHGFLTEIRNASLRGKRIIQQLMSFSRPRVNKRMQIDLRAVVEDALRGMKGTFPVTVDVGENLPDSCDPVSGDFAQLGLVVVHLVDNAIQAMTNGRGRIEITLNNVSTGEPENFFDVTLPAGEYVCLQVTDNGCGIEADRMRNLFDPFYTTREIGKGSGMGLSVVHGIMKGHGGGIRISSRPGEGTVAQCFFPSVTKTAFTIPQAAQAPLGGCGIAKILYLDDEPAIAKMGQMRLERLGYQVETSTDPLEALQLVRTEPNRFSLVITDLTMPQLSGDQLIVQLKEINPDIKTILCSGYKEKMEDGKAGRIGADAFLCKPFDKNELADAVRKVLDPATGQGGA